MLAAPGPAAALSFTAPSTFQAAVSGGTVGTLDFESIAAGAPLSAAGLTQSVGGTSVGITFPAGVVDVFGGPDLALQVHGLGLPGSHVLGTDDPGNFGAFIGGTPLGLGFTEPVHAFGLTLISVDMPGVTLLDGDVEVAAAGQTAALVVADRILLGSAPLAGGGTQDVYAYFLGVTSAAPFTSASLEPGPGLPDGAIFYWLDDFVVAVPEPTLALFLAAAAATMAAFRRRLGGRSAGAPTRDARRSS